MGGYTLFEWQSIACLIPREDDLWSYDLLTALIAANDLLCSVFSAFPLALRYGNGMAVEMPDIKPNGIRPALYYMLRVEYMLRRPIAICAHRRCARYFVPDRAGGHSHRCRGLIDLESTLIVSSKACPLRHV